MNVIVLSRCEKILCEQHAFYHPPKIKGAPTGQEQTLKVVYELDFRDLVAAQEPNRTSSSKAGRAPVRVLLAKLVKALELPEQNFGEDILDLVAIELSKLRPLGDPRHSLRSAQVCFCPCICGDPLRCRKQQHLVDSIL